MTTLVGDHVRLEPLRHVHGDDLLAAATESRSSYEFTWVPGDRASVTAFIKETVELERGNAALAYAVVDQRTGRAVGSSRLHAFERWSGRPEPDAVEIGHTWYAASSQRTACNTETKLLMLTHAFETWKVVRVVLKTDARNERSRDAILRLGARFEGVRRRTQLAWDGTIRDTAFFSIVDDEWPDVRARLEQRLAGRTGVDPRSQPVRRAPLVDSALIRHHRLSAAS